MKKPEPSTNLFMRKLLDGIFRLKQDQSVAISKLKVRFRDTDDADVVGVLSLFRFKTCTLTALVFAKVRREPGCIRFAH